MTRKSKTKTLPLLFASMVGVAVPSLQMLAQSVYTPYTFTTIAARFGGPTGVAVDSTRNIYVADRENQTIWRVSPAGAVTTLVGMTGSPGSADGTNSAARFFDPNGVAVDSVGNIYVADTGNSTIRRVSPAGVVITLAGMTGSSGTADGTNSDARFFYPSGLALDSAGNIYVADRFNQTIRKVTPLGTNWLVTTLTGQVRIAGSADGPPGTAQFYNPYDVAVDSAGNVYVAEEMNCAIRKVTPEGVVTTLAGLAGSYGSADGTGSDARFRNPSGVAVDGAGNVYVGDENNNTIRKVTSEGVVSTLAGLAGSYDYADGTGSGARFNSPSGVAVDSAGNVYVADWGNGTIRKGYPTFIIQNPGFIGGQFGFTLSGPIGQTVVVDASTDHVNWLPAWTNTLADDLSFTDPQSGGSSNRFYRAHTP